MTDTVTPVQFFGDPLTWTVRGWMLWRDVAKFPVQTISKYRPSCHVVGQRNLRPAHELLEAQ